MDDNISLFHSAIKFDTNQNNDANSQVMDQTEKKHVKMKHNKWTVLLVELACKQVNICR